MASARPNLVGVDVGGTFTDLVLRNEDDGTIRVAKVPSTPGDQSQGFMEGLAELGHDAASVALIIHGTTVATNAVIERKGVRCLLVTTKGFRDILELGRRDRPDVYGLTGTVRPLIPRHRRVEVDERVRSDGSVEKAIDAAEVLDAVAPLMNDVEAVVVSFLHSYVNPVHEDLAISLLRERWPTIYVIAAGASLPKVGEFERTSTAAVHAYVQPIMARYLGALASAVDGAGYAQPPAIVQCNGGVMSLAHAIERPANTVRSGPAAGVISGAAVAHTAGFANAITADMGGTSFDVALVVDQQPALTDEKLVDFRIPLRVPTIDVETIGAGGGSLAQIDAAGILEVGPRSAGAVPGPACYGRGGDQPTVTDANMVLGRINPSRAIGGKRLDLDRDLSVAAVQERVARPLGLSVEDAAEAIIRVIDSRMAGQVRIMSIGRGHDPREFVLVAFGGAGPLHGAAIIHETGIPRCIMPPLPGVTSAIGCIDADVQYDFVQSVRERLDEVDLSAVNKIVEAYIATGRELIARGGVPVTGVSAIVEAEMHYVGQRHPIRVTVPTPLGREDVAQAFEQTYRLRYGASLDAPEVLVDLNCRVVGHRPRPDTAPAPSSRRPWSSSIVDRRPVYFGGEWRETAILERSALRSGMHGGGPAIVEQNDTTSVVPPGMTAYVDGAGNLIVEHQ